MIVAHLINTSNLSGWTLVYKGINECWKIIIIGSYFFVRDQNVTTLFVLGTGAMLPTTSADPFFSGSADYFFTFLIYYS